MLILSLLLAPALAFSAPLSATTTAPSNRSDELSIPGAVFIRGGRTNIGSDKKDLEKMMNENENLQRLARAYDAETPMKKIAVGDFWLSTTEVTNEQYREFVSATSYKPPVEWGAAALDTARRAYLEEQGKAASEARKAGKKFTTQKFDEEDWWAKNWTESEWEMPNDIALRPVVRVSHADALAYCKWAGMRLPTEFEFQRAIRGDRSEDYYPWGAEWDADDYCVTRENGKPRRPNPVGSAPKGSTPDGIHDLLGNVWEWTDSPYVAYDGHKDSKYTFGKGSSKETVEPEGRFDANQRVAVGGSFTHDKTVARATTRRACDRTQTTTALGFRTAATPGSPVDVASAISDSEIRNASARPDGVHYVPEQVTGLHLWETAPSMDSKAPAGYSVVKSYDYMIFVPVEKLDASSDVEIARRSLGSPVHLGFFSTNQQFENPKLDPGTYFIAFRGQGKERKKRGDDETADGEEVVQVEDPFLSQIDSTKDNFLFIDAETGELAAALETPSVAVEAGVGGSFEFKQGVEWETIDGEQVQKQVKQIELTAYITTGRGRGFKMTLPMRAAEGVADKPWRSK